MRAFGRWAAMSGLATVLLAVVGRTGERASAGVPEAREERRTATAVAPPSVPIFFFIQTVATQSEPGARLLARTADVTASLEGDGFAFTANGSGGGKSVVGMAFDGLGAMRWEPEDELTAPGSSFHGRDPSAWTRGAPLYAAAVAHTETGAEVRIAGDSGRIAYSLRLPPGTPRERIALRFESASALAIDADGRLVVSVRGGRWTHAAPRAWQETATGRRPVACRFVVGADAMASIACGPCDRAATLVIDPTVTFARTFGEPNRWEFDRNRVAVDGDGGLAYAFEAGDPLPSPYYGQMLTTDLLVLRFDAGGHKLLWSASLGSGCSPGALVARDSGAVLVAGTTNDAASFPHIASAFSTGGGYADAFIAQLAPGGASLEFSTTYGGTGNADPDFYDPDALPGDDYVHDACIDGEGGIVVVGESQSTGAPLVGQFARDTIDAYDGFVLRLSADGSTAIHAGYFGGTGIDGVNSVCAGPNGSVFIAGTTASTDLPTRNSLIGLSGAGSEGFVARLLPNGELAWGTRLGGSADDTASVVAAASDGSVYVAGSTVSSNLPVAGPGPFGPGGDGDLFVMHIDPATRSLLQSVRIGGTNSEDVWAGARDSAGRLWLTGITNSTDFPLSNELSTNAGATASQSYVPFVVVLDAGCGLLSSGYLGGSGYGLGTDVAVVGRGSAWLAGQTYSADFPLVDPGEGPEAGSAYLMAAAFSPSRPESVRAEVTSATAVRVTWTHDGRDLDHFEVQSGVDGTGTFVSLGLPGVAARTFTGANDHPLRIVAYRVRAWATDVASPWSDVALVTLPAAPPSAPVGLSLEVAEDGNLHLAWTDTSDAETGFEISRTAPGASSAEIFPLPADTISWDDVPPLPDRGSVAYRVRATNAAGASAWTGIATYSTPATLDVALVKGRIHAAKSPKGSSIHLVGTVRRIDDTAFGPVSAGLTIVLGGWSGTEVLHVDADASGWRFRRGTWTWSSPRRTNPRAHFVYVPKSGRVVVSVSRVLLPELESGAITTSLGNSVDGGSDASDWRGRNGALRLR